MAAASLGRNDPCPCGSGKKYKKCCLGKGETVRPRVEEPTGPTHVENAANWFSGMEAEIFHLDNLMHEAEHAVDDGDFKRAEELYEAIRKHSPETLHGSYLLGKLRGAQGRWADAAAAYEEGIRLIEADPGNFDDEVLKEMRQGLDQARSKMAS